MSKIVYYCYSIDGVVSRCATVLLDSSVGFVRSYIFFHEHLWSDTGGNLSGRQESKSAVHWKSSGLLGSLNII